MKNRPVFVLNVKKRAEYIGLKVKQSMNLLEMSRRTSKTEKGGLNVPLTSLIKRVEDIYTKKKLYNGRDRQKYSQRST